MKNERRVNKSHALGMHTVCTHTPALYSMEVLDSIGLWTSLCLCCFLSVIFVCSLYIVDPRLPRSHALTVHRRICAISVLCFIVPVILFLYISYHQNISITSFLYLLGLRESGLLAAVFCPPLLVTVLYIGPIFQCWIEGNNLFGDITSQRKDLILRNYVFAPVAEELIFRACMLLILCPATGEWWAIFICPCFFAFAHVHHLIDWYRVNSGISFRKACQITLIQVCYTSFFGVFAGFLFVRTRHLAGLIICHSLCNLLGLPPIESALQYSVHRKYCILALYVFGVVLFFYLLFPMTAPSLYYNVL